MSIIPKKACLFLLCSTFYLTASCTTAAPTQPSISNPNASSLSTESLSLPQTPQTTSGFWDVSDIDIDDVAPDKKLLAFTFDDAPTSRLENLLAVFADFNQQTPSNPASATLFINGKRCHNDALPTLRAAWTMQFELGNHTQTHPDLTSLDAQAILEELQKTDTILSQIDKKDIHLFRPPYGKINDEIKRLSKTPIIDWTIDTLDWTGLSETDIYDKVMQNKADGSIVLFHDGYPNTISAIKRLLPDLTNCGYQVVTVSKMAKAHNCPLRNGSVYIRARKQTSAQ
jgi:peptidoglycan/xylan/chitin deacetylase (PgdA/CDA1 family)